MTELKQQHAQALYQSVQTRPRSEDVAELALSVLDPVLSASERNTLEVAARHSLKRRAWHYSSMMQDFHRPESNVGRQIAVAGVLFNQLAPETLVLTPVEAIDPEAVLRYVQRIGLGIGKQPGANDFRTDRLATKTARRAAGVAKNARWYNKRWRTLQRIEQKLVRLICARSQYEFTRVSTSALATRLELSDIQRDADTACFVAYMAARLSMRSEFTNTSQKRAFDEIADMLFKRCARSESTDWFTIAHVYPDAAVLGHLSDDQKGQLIGAWWDIMGSMAGTLESVWQASSFDLPTMIVSRGTDSSTWNRVAGAWNIARAHWISLLHAAHQDAVLDAVCPGKVMRVMATDVARWHLSSGGDVHPDTKVWAKLPPPWRVIRGDALCTRSTIEQACRDARVKPATWVEAKRQGEIEAFTPTPELVHGVAVASPDLAAIIRRAGVFSGKAVRYADIPDTMEVIRDEHGAAVQVVESLS